MGGQYLMDIKEIGSNELIRLRIGIINNMSSFAQCELLECPWKCGIEPPDYISHRVSELD